MLPGETMPFVMSSTAGTASVALSDTGPNERSPGTTPGCEVAVALAVLFRISLGCTASPSFTEKTNVALPPPAIEPPVKVTVPDALLNVKPAGVVTAVMLPNFAVSTMSLTATS